ncbi:MAG: energy transducer TonB [Bacteroidetes bacterium]|nr:MAG: energy transducer TonB [Bacteroidota bacterium]
MENKKNPQVKLEKQTKLFFGISLAVSLGLILFVFELNFMQSLSGDALSLKKNQNDTETPMIEPPLTQQQYMPPPQAIQSPEIKAVDDKKKVDKFIEETIEKPTEQKKVIKPTDETSLVIPKKQEIEEEGNIGFLPHELQEQAEFVGGQKEFYKFLSDNIKYPKVARRINVQGTVYLEFIIEKNGELSDVKVKKPIVNDGGCNEEAVRVLKKSPKWKPAKQRGKNVRQKMVIPVKFKLE